jgi:hypothetical protein
LDQLLASRNHVDLEQRVPAAAAASAASAKAGSYDGGGCCALSNSMSFIGDYQSHHHHQSLSSIRSIFTAATTNFQEPASIILLACFSRSPNNVETSIEVQH